MVVYKEITSAGIETLITKNEKSSGNVSSISISNNSTSNAATVSLQLWDGTSVGHNIIGNMVIPAGVVLLLDNNLSFNAKYWNLRTEVSGTSPTLSIIIK